jgi:hypothetical protein
MSFVPGNPPGYVRPMTPPAPFTAPAIERAENWSLDEPYGLPITSSVSGRVKLFGFAVEESTGVAIARLVLFDGTDQTVTTFYPIRLDPNESTAEWLGPNGVTFRQGILPVVTSGAVAGMLYVADISH